MFGDWIKSAVGASKDAREEGLREAQVEAGERGVDARMDTRGGAEGDAGAVGGGTSSREGEDAGLANIVKLLEQAAVDVVHQLSGHLLLQGLGVIGRAGATRDARLGGGWSDEGDRRFSSAEQISFAKTQGCENGRVTRVKAGEPIAEIQLEQGGVGVAFVKKAVDIVVEGGLEEGGQFASAGGGKAVVDEADASRESG